MNSERIKGKLIRKIKTEKKREVISLIKYTYIVVKRLKMIALIKVNKYK